MANLGFTSYDTVAPAPPTVPEILAAMSGAQKVAVLNGFINQIKPIDFRQWMKDNDPSTDNRIPRAAVVRLYTEIDAIEEW